MKKLLIAFFSLILISCEKDDKEAYYSIENTCKLDRVESKIYGNPMYVHSDGYELIYNSQNQVIKKAHFYQYSDTETENSIKRDSICYKNGCPFEGYFYYKSTYSAGWLMKHEKYTFNGNNLGQIDFTVYAISFDNMIMHTGITNFVYDGTKILSSKTVINTDAVTTKTDCSYEFDGENLIQIVEISWSKAIAGGTLEGLINEDTSFTTKKYLDYNDKLNPYNGLFLLLDFREESLSKNIYNYYEETAIKNSDTTNYTVKSGNYFSYYETGLPESDAWSFFYYDCDN